MTKEEYFGIVDKEIERLKNESEYYKILATESNGENSEQNAFMVDIIDCTIELLEQVKPLPKFLLIQNMSLDKLNREKERINLNLEKNISLFRETQKEEKKKKSELKNYVDESVIWYYEWLCDHEINWCNGRIFQIELLQSELKQDSGSFIRRILMDEASLDVLKDKYYHNMLKKEDYYPVGSSINSCLDFNKAKKVASLLEDIYKKGSPFCVSDRLPFAANVIIDSNVFYNKCDKRILDVDLFLNKMESYLLMFNEIADKKSDDFTDEKILPLMFRDHGTISEDCLKFYELHSDKINVDTFKLLKKTIKERDEFSEDSMKIYELDKKIKKLMHELDQSILFELHHTWNFEEYVQDRIVKGLEPAVSEGYREHISNFRSELVGLIENLKAKKLEIDTIKKGYDEETIKIVDDIISLYSKTKGCVKYSYYSNNLNFIVKLLAYINRDRIIDNIIEEAQNLLVEEQMQELEKTNDISADDGIDIDYYSNILELTDGGYSLRLKTKM